MAVESLKRSEIRKKLRMIKDPTNFLLDSGPTFSCCNNSKMLVNIENSRKSINGVSNGGVMLTNKEDYLPSFFTIYYHPKSLMNILSISNLRKRFKVTMDISKEVAILVHIAKNKVMKSIEIGAGLYIWKSEHNSSLLNKKIFVFFP